VKSDVYRIIRKKLGYILSAAYSERYGNTHHDEFGAKRAVVIAV